SRLHRFRAVAAEIARLNAVSPQMSLLHRLSFCPWVAVGGGGWSRVARGHRYGHSLSGLLDGTIQGLAVRHASFHSDSAMYFNVNFRPCLALDLKMRSVRDENSVNKLA